MECDSVRKLQFRHRFISVHDTRFTSRNENSVPINLTKIYTKILRNFYFTFVGSINSLSFFYLTLVFCTVVPYDYFLSGPNSTLLSQ